MAQPDIARLKLSSKIGKRAPVFTAEFSNGKIASDTMVQFECYKSENRESMIESGCAERKLVATNGHLTYIGDSNDKSVLRYFVGVRNKNTGKMKLYDSTHFRLKPDMSSKHVVNNNANTEKNFRQERTKLTEEFGGKTQKRILKARLKLDVQDDTFNELVNDSIDASPVTPDPFANSPLTASYLPPTNKETTFIDKVFDINDIISPDIDTSLRDHVNSWLEAYKADADAAKLNFCKFASQHLNENLNNLEKLKYLVYYNYLVIFQHLTYKDVQRKNPTDLIPEPFKGSILEKFTVTTKHESGGRTSRGFPLQMKDKLISHLIVLALFICDYCVCMTHILSDLKSVNPKKCMTIAQALGCHITSKKLGDETQRFIELKLPLNVVLPRFKRRQI